MSANHRSAPLGVIAASFGALLLSGCAVHPLQEDVTGKTTKDIVQQVRCEAKRALLHKGGALRAGSVAYDFEFNIIEHNNASGGFTLTNPFTTGVGGIFSVGASVGADRVRDAVRNFKIVDSFDELRRATCERAALEKNWVYPLSGEVGMYDAVIAFIELQLLDGPVDKEIFTFADTLVFSTTLHADATAKLTLNPVKDRLRVTAAGADLTNSRKDVHKVIVTMIGGPLGGARASGVAGRASMRAFGVVPGNALLSTTLVQQASSYKDRALYELDRQRTLEFQRRALNVIVAP